MSPRPLQSVKPDSRTAMAQLIEQVRNTLPFEADEAQLCQGPCQGCSRKLLEFLDMELEDWSMRLQRGETPSLGELSKLARRCQKIHRALQRSGLLCT